MMKFNNSQTLITVIIYLISVADGGSVMEWDLNEDFWSGDSNGTIRMKRQIVSTHIAAWQRIYHFTIHVARVAGNNALMARMADAMHYEYAAVSRSYTYGYYGGFGGRRLYGYGGYGYGGYPYGYGYGGYPFSQPIIYYVPVAQQQSSFPFNGIYDFVSDVGSTVSNSELLEQLITLIQQAIDDTYSSYDGGDGGGDTEAPA